MNVLTPALCVVVQILDEARSTAPKSPTCDFEQTKVPFVTLLFISRPLRFAEPHQTSHLDNTHNNTITSFSTLFVTLTISSSYSLVTLGLSALLMVLLAERRSVYQREHRYIPSSGNVTSHINRYPFKLSVNIFACTTQKYT